MRGFAASIFFHPDCRLPVEASLSVPELHRVSGHPFGWPVADYTAGGESHPALKTRIQLLSAHKYTILEWKKQEGISTEIKNGGFCQIYCLGLYNQEHLFYN